MSINVTHKNMPIKVRQTRTRHEQARINIPLNGLTYLYKNEQNGRAVCEIDLALLKQVNDENFIDMIIRDARSDYKAGNYKTANNAAELISDLRGSYED